MKMESVRAAGKVGLQNQAAEMQHSFHAQLEERVAKLQSGGSDALHAAHKEIEELKEQIDREWPQTRGKRKRR